jgi:hypothetical protein
MPNSTMAVSPPKSSAAPSSRPTDLTSLVLILPVAKAASATFWATSRQVWRPLPLKMIPFLPKGRSLPSFSRMLSRQSVYSSARSSTWTVRRV